MCVCVCVCTFRYTSYSVLYIVNANIEVHHVSLFNKVESLDVSEYIYMFYVICAPLITICIYILYI